MVPQVINAMQAKGLEWRGYQEGEDLCEETSLMDDHGNILLGLVVRGNGSLSSNNYEVTLPAGMFDMDGAKKFAYSYYVSVLNKMFKAASNSQASILRTHYETRQVPEADARGYWARVKDTYRYRTDADTTACSGVVVWNMLGATLFNYGANSGVPVLDNVVLGRYWGMAGNNATGIFLLLQLDSTHGWGCTGVTDIPTSAGYWASKPGDAPVGNVLSCAQVFGKIEELLDNKYPKPAPPVEGEGGFLDDIQPEQGVAEQDELGSDDMV